MNNIATPIKTSAPRPFFRPGLIDSVIAAAPTLLAATIFTTLLIGFAPFAAGEVVITGEAPAGGNIVNQIGYSALGGLALGGMAMFCRPDKVLRLPSLLWLLVVAAYLFAVANSPEPPLALRVMAFSFIAVIAMISVVLLARDDRALQNAVATGALAVLGLSYFGVFAFPDAARHTAEVFEPLNEGLWRGIYQHKNTAGPMMAFFVFAGIWLIRAKRTAVGLLITALACFFLLQSGSKTSAGTVFLVLAIVLLPSLIGLRGLALILFGMVFVLFAVGTVGTVLFESVRDLNDTLAPDNTFTGRIALWEFSVQMISKQPFTGYGLESLWAKPAVMDMERPFDSDWDFRGIVHGHNSYLDTMLDLGVIGFCAVAIVVLIQPSVDYLRARRLTANILAADFFLMILIFSALNAFMETFFFRRGDPVWMMMVFAIAGLRWAAIEPMRQR
jgi:O-antigen ligase